MRRAALTLVLLVATGAARADQTDRLDVGSVEMLEITALTRDHVSAWARTLLPFVARGSKQTFEGTVEVSNVYVPVTEPIVVAVQKKPGKSEAVFFLELDLEKAPADLLSKAGAHALDMTLRGTLKGENGTQEKVLAVGVLKYGTAEVKTGSATARAFARFGGARFTGFTLVETSGEATASLYNPFAFPIDVKEIVYELRVGDQAIASGSKKGLRLYPRRDNPVALPAVARNSDLLAVAGSAVVTGGRIEGRLVASIRLRIGKDEVVIPVDVPGTIEVAK